MTAVEWLRQELLKRDMDNSIKDLFEQAKEMEKEQIKDAFVECWKLNVPDGVECKLDAEQYYKKNYEQ